MNFQWSYNKTSRKRCKLCGGFDVPSTGCPGFQHEEAKQDHHAGQVQGSEAPWGKDSEQKQSEEATQSDEAIQGDEATQGGEATQSDGSESCQLTESWQGVFGEDL